MCGIAGIVAWDEKYRIKREQLQRMADALAHRGPDGEGFYLNFDDREITSDNPQCGFAFRRLAIIDPDPRSNQPFTIGHLTLVFNGEIYNYRELRSELSRLRPDYAWRTQGDTEVLLMAYEVWREQCVERLNGMFAFAVWDDREKSLFLARDRMGQKPLYLEYRTRMERDGFASACVAFASELHVIRHLPWFDREIDPISLERYLAYGYTRGSIYNGVLQMLPDTYLHFDRGSRRAEKYFDANTPSGPSTDTDTAKTTRDLIEQAVARQLVSDVPLGVLLSGGTDSSVIALCARRAGPTQTFNIEFGNPRYDESKYGLAVARHLGTEHHSFRVTPAVIDDLPKLVAVFGEPFADSSAIPTHYLARETRGHVKVALGGDGGDELFGGYDRYRAIHASRHVGRVIPSLAAAGLARIAGGHPKSIKTRATRFLRSLALPVAMRYASYVAVFDPVLLTELLGKATTSFADADTSQIVETLFESYRARGASAAEAALAVDRVTYLPNDLLTKLDRCSMLHGLEVRSPFMDHELVQFAAGLTADQLLKGGPKRMLREAFAKDLPDFVFKRPKMGFAVPIGEWFRGELRPMLRDNLFASDSFGKQHFNMTVVERLVDEHESQRIDHSQRLYALLMLELWWRWQRNV